jgi:hypothetical protein
MSIRRVVPDITCNRIDESRNFYTEVLGFDMAMDMDWVVTLASPSNPTAQITLVHETGSEPQPNMTIEVDDRMTLTRCMRRPSDLALRSFTH